MRNWLLLAAIVLIATTTDAAERIVGLVEIPVFHGGDYEEMSKYPKGSVTLFKEPSKKAAVAVVIEDFNQLEIREHGYEKASAVFYELRHTSDSGVWFKVRYRIGNAAMLGWSVAWLKGADAGQIHRYGQLVGGGLSYFTKSWDKCVFQRPERSSPSTCYDDLGERQDVAVADVRYLGKDATDLWFLVVIRKGSICGDSDNDGTTIITTGWVPAYANDGSETVWYYSRGC